MSMFNDGDAEDWELGDAIRIPVDLDGPDGDEDDSGAADSDEDGAADEAGQDDAGGN